VFHFHFALQHALLMHSYGILNVGTIFPHVHSRFTKQCHLCFILIFLFRTLWKCIHIVNLNSVLLFLVGTPALRSNVSCVSFFFSVLFSMFGNALHLNVIFAFLQIHTSFSLATHYPFYFLFKTLFPLWLLNLLNQRLPLCHLYLSFLFITLW